LGGTITWIGIFDLSIESTAEIWVRLGCWHHLLSNGMFRPTIGSKLNGQTCIIGVNITQNLSLD